MLKHLCDEGFKKLIYLDTDVYIQGNLESIWREVEQKILLYDINHGLEVEDYKSFCSEVKKFQTSKGDEFIVSLAADEMPECIKNAGAYIYRFWTGATFRLVSTCYEYNKVLILYLPAEKGMLRLYSNYIRKGKMPSEQKVWKICRLKHRTFLDYIGYTGITFLKKLRKK